MVPNSGCTHCCAIDGVKEFRTILSRLELATKRIDTLVQWIFLRA
jgi:hypothetical protein